MPADSGDDGNVATFESGTVIDYCFLKNADALDVISYKVYNVAKFGSASDHYPVFMVIKY